MQTYDEFPRWLQILVAVWSIGLLPLGGVLMKARRNSAEIRKLDAESIQLTTTAYADLLNRNNKVVERLEGIVVQQGDLLKENQMLLSRARADLQAMHEQVTECILKMREYGVPTEEIKMPVSGG